MSAGRGTPGRPAAVFGEYSALALAAATAGGTAFSVLLLLVLSAWEPLAAADTAVSLEINEWVSGSSATAAVLRVMTNIGDAALTVAVLALLTLVLLIRRVPRLATWVAVTGIGLAILDPLVKELVGRSRPTLPVEIATAPGHSFPSGHALASFTTITILLLVALPAVPPRARRAVVAAGVALILAVGISRVALGVHYVSDVIAGWALAALWVSGTAFAFRAWQAASGRPQPQGLTGLEPQAGDRLQPAPPDSARLHAGAAGRLAAGLALVTAIVAGFGLLVTDVLRDTVIGRWDRAVVEALAGGASPALDQVVELIGSLGGTRAITVVAVGTGILAVAIVGRWRPLAFLAASLAGEVTIYLLVSRCWCHGNVRRPASSRVCSLQPPVTHPGTLLPR